MVWFHAEFDIYRVHTEGAKEKKRKVRKGRTAKSEEVIYSSRFVNLVFSI